MALFAPKQNKWVSPNLINLERVTQQAITARRPKRKLEASKVIAISAKLTFFGQRSKLLYRKMATYLWRKYADYVHTKWERMILWNMVEPYTRPKSFKPLVTIYIAAFYTGVIGSAITEQLYKEKYWEDHPGEAVPLMKPKFYSGPWRVMRGEVPTSQ